jgi:hypothetical protein
MRCPKCGYISFDHIDTCLKCKKTIPEGAVQAEGTTFNVEAPSFLKLQSSEKRTSKVMDLDDDFGEPEEDLDVVDPDLDILLEEDGEPEEDREIELNGRFDELENGEFKITSDDEEDEVDVELTVEEEEVEIDLGQFGDFEEEEVEEFEEDGEIEISMPDELSDISDLSAPGENDENIDAPQGGEPGSGNISGDGFDLNLDLDDLDSNFSLSSEDDDGKEASLGDLSFDDIGLSDEPAPAAPAPIKSSGFDDMDSDLDFDLDLGDLFGKKE